MGHKRKLQQVFLNLMNNSLAALGEGGEVTVKTGYDRSSRRVTVLFRDNGEGIAQKDLKRIFDPFFTTKSIGEGTGLGLFVTYGIIKQYGGTIECLSSGLDQPEKPSGTQFIIKLKPRTAGTAMTGRILVIDDEKDMLLLLSRIITEEGAYQVVTESDPLRAMALFKEQPFDLVLTDLKMPKMNGIEVLEQVKRTSPDVSVIILTAFATIDNAVAAVHKGAYDYLTKPFQRERLLLTIEKVMALQELVRENMTLRQALAKKEEQTPIVGSSPFVKDMEQRIRQVGPTMATGPYHRPQRHRKGAGRPGGP